MDKLFTFGKNIDKHSEFDIKQIRKDMSSNRIKMEKEKTKNVDNVQKESDERYEKFREERENKCIHYISYLESTIKKVSKHGDDYHPINITNLNLSRYGRAIDVPCVKKIKNHFAKYNIPVCASGAGMSGITVENKDDIKIHISYFTDDKFVSHYLNHVNYDMDMSDKESVDNVYRMFMWQ